MMSRKKIVFVIVEGVSDRTALGVLLEKIFAPSNVYVHITHGDVTTKTGVNPSDIIKTVTNYVKSYAKSTHFTNKDFQEIIHIVDTDGAYIPDDCAIFDVDSIKIKYSLVDMRTRNREAVLNRNAQKRDNLNKLSECTTIWSIKYRIFYMSRNLDHVLYNKLESVDVEKERDAIAFVRKYRSNIPDFLRFITSSDFSVSVEYKDSWQFIKAELNSLKRYTNLGLCFDL